MTVNQMRQKLGRIVTKVFTPSFSAKYEMISKQTLTLPRSADSLVTTYAEDADAYIRLASQLLSDQASLDDLSRAANPLVIYVVFFRYHFVTQFLIAANQEEERVFPSQDAAFLRAVLIKNWKSLLIEHTST